MRQLLPALLLFAASTALTPLAHADAIDDFVLTGDGHTFRFSLPANGTAGAQNGQVRGFYFSGNTDATVDGVGGYTANGLFRFDSFSYPRAEFNFSNPNLGSSFAYALYGPQLVLYTLPPDGYGLANVFYNIGSFDYATSPYTPPYQQLSFTLTVTPEASPTVTPEPATLALLATGALGLFTRIRSRGTSA